MPERDFIGRGWAFPVKVNVKGGLSWSSGPARIEDAIWIIVSTSVGERVMRPSFGGGAHDFVFEPNSALRRGDLAAQIREALVKSEPRINVTGVRVEEQPGAPSEVRVSIDYQIRSTNELFNVVYPLYIEEGVS
jgi:phage baseplate assembly protein W